MNRKKYPKLTHSNATDAAKVYMIMSASERFIWRTTDLTTNSATRGYSAILQALHRLHDNGFLGRMTIGDAGNIWWLKERMK